MFIKINNYVHIQLHYNYDILFTIILNKKLNQQYINFFKILKKNKTFDLQIRFVFLLTNLFDFIRNSIKVNNFFVEFFFSLFTFESI